MNVRMRRLSSDYAKIQETFSNHPNITVTPVQNDPPEIYHVVYRLPGIRMESNAPKSQLEHSVRLTLPINYPRQKPVCTISTPIWHPNFRDGQICIGDIWGAGETLVDIIIHIGDMIQYRIWNTKSPLSADAAHWAAANSNLFPVGNIELWQPDPNGNRLASNMTKTPIHMDSDRSSEEEIDIDFNETIVEKPIANPPTATNLGPISSREMSSNIPTSGNDIEISADELHDVSWNPKPEQIQYSSQASNLNQPSYTNNNHWNQTTFDTSKSTINVKTLLNKGVLAGIAGGLLGWLIVEQMMDSSWGILLIPILSAVISFILAAWEEFYAGARGKVVKTGFKRFSIGLGTGFFGGIIAGVIFNNLTGNIYVTDQISDWIVELTLYRAIVWTILGASIGLSQGLFPVEKIRLKNGLIGGAIGGFLGGLPFDYLTVLTDEAIVPRAIGFTLIGLFIGLGISLVEQISKQAWLQVVRGDFEGKEFILQYPIVRIGSTVQSNIVLFKDKLISPVHSEIRLENGRHVIFDMNSANGSYINGRRVANHILKEGDSIAVGNTIMIYRQKNVKQ